MSTRLFLSELFRIVEGALRLDGEKVRNYAKLLADKLEAEGEKASADRLRKLISEQGHELRPARVDQSGSPPVDGESRFPLLERVNLSSSVDHFVFTAHQRQFLDEYLSVVKGRGALEAKGLESRTNLLLYGPPGCGKTHLASYVAQKVGLPLYVVRLDGLISSFLGSTSKNIRAVLEFASKNPCVLLLDEFDAIAKLRDDQQEHGELKRVVNSFIQNLDSLGTEVILIGATNHEQLLDGAVWRRFQYLLSVGLPDFDQRRELWRLYSVDLDWSGKQLKVLADLTEGFSCAAIETVSRKLRQRLATVGEVATVRKAVLELVWLSRAEPSARMFLTTSSLDTPEELIKQLRRRDSSLYSLSAIGEVLGKSKATMSRARLGFGEKKGSSKGK